MINTEFIAQMRHYAAVGGVGWVVLHSKSVGTIPINHIEITSRPKDEDLTLYIEQRCRGEI